jgi:predicted DCC family thiol-disulfide oxidoreductase YuxK
MAPTEANRDLTDDRPTLVYDGHCRFCVTQAERLARLVLDRVRLESFRDPGVLARHRLNEAACEAAIQLVEPDGTITSGAAAIARTVRLRPVLAPLGWLHAVPGLGRLLEAIYGVVARNRFRLGGASCPDGTCRLHR